MKITLSVMIHPRFGCAIGAAYTVAAIPGGVPIANCGPGCADKQYRGLAGENGFQGATAVSGGNMPSVNFGENEVVFGGAKKLDALIQSSLKIMKGDLFVVLTGCSGELIGDNVASKGESAEDFSTFGPKFPISIHSGVETIQN